MNPILKNVIAVIAGIIFGSLVNMGIINISGSVIPSPDGSDVTTIEGLKASMNLFEPKHFIMPFLAHALGTFAAAFLAIKIAPSHQMKIAIGIGIFYLAGGITNIILLPSPLWYGILDLACAYIPMAYLAGTLANKKT